MIVLEECVRPASNLTALYPYIRVPTGIRAYDIDLKGSGPQMLRNGDVLFLPTYDILSRQALPGNKHALAHKRPTSLAQQVSSTLICTSRLIRVEVPPGLKPRQRWRQAAALPRPPQSAGHAARTISPSPRAPRAPPSSAPVHSTALNVAPTPPTIPRHVPQETSEESAS